MYRKIMVPLDGSEFAEMALAHALALSRKAGAALHLTTVLSPQSLHAPDLQEEVTSNAARAYLDDVLQRVEAHAGAEVTMSIGSGDVADLIGEQAAEVEADLIVMATHGRGGLSRLWLGSVADRFVRRAVRPVLLVRPREGEPGPLDAELAAQRILVPLDGSDAAEAALTHAESMGALSNAEYVLVRVVAPSLAEQRPYFAGVLPTDAAAHEQARRDEAEEYLAAAAQPMKERGRVVDTHVYVAAQPAEALLRAAKEAECDLVVMAPQKRSGVSRALVGSTADKLVRGSQVPVLLYRPVD